MNQKLIDKFNYVQEKNRQGWIVSSKKRDEETNIQTEEIKKELKRLDAELKWTNGYVFEFKYDNYECCICNQTRRFVGSAHRKITDEKELEIYGEINHLFSMVEDSNSSSIMGYSRDDILEFIEEFKYVDFCENFNSIPDGVCKIISKLINRKVYK